MKNKKAKILDNKTHKLIQSEDYNMIFDKSSGLTLTWGKTQKDNPDYCPFGNIILDIEVTTKCTGPGNKLCKFCYKANTPNGINMSFDTFKTIIDKLPPTLTQIAFGADAKAESNQDLFKMMDYVRNEKGIIPNITVADISDEIADNLAKYCGAVAVSLYDDKNYCYNSIKKLTDRGMTQINIHSMISKETLNNTYNLIEDIKNKEPRLEKLNAVVFLSLKQKGRGTNFTPLTQDEFDKLALVMIDNNIPFGFDSCSAQKFINTIKKYKSEELDKYLQLAEPCESGCFSAYINTEGKYYHCSFCEDTLADEFINMLDVKDFLKDVWYSDIVNNWRTKLLNNNRHCPVFNI